MMFFRKRLLILSCLLALVYPAYRLKSALGIDIWPTVHGPDLIKKPLKTIISQFKSN